MVKKSQKFSVLIAKSQNGCFEWMFLRYLIGSGVDDGREQRPRIQMFECQENVADGR